MERAGLWREIRDGEKLLKSIQEKLGVKMDFHGQELTLTAPMGSILLLKGDRTQCDKMMGLSIKAGDHRPEVAQQLLGGSAMGRDLHGNFRSYAVKNILSHMRPGRGINDLTIGLAACLAQTEREVVARERTTPPLVGEGCEIVDCVESTYVVFDLDLETNKWGYSHELCVFCNYITGAMQQMSHAKELHPHVTSSEIGGFCIDHDYRVAIGDAMKAKNPLAIATLLKEALEVINFSDAYRVYPGLTTCRECGEVINEDDEVICDECENRFCTYCGEGELLCSNCRSKIECGHCERRIFEIETAICKKCGIRGCSYCLHRVNPVDFLCMDCIEKCPICGEAMASNTSPSPCGSCGKIVCASHLKREAGINKCPECIRVCGICGGDLPSDHSHTCTECGKVICCEHSSTRTGEEVVCLECLGEMPQQNEEEKDNGETPEAGEHLPS